MKTKISNRAANAIARADSKSGALRALLVFAAQNPGFEWANYATGNWAESARAHRGDSRPVSRQWSKIMSLLWACRDLSDADLIAASNRAFSGRLQFVEKNGAWSVDYCAGQYWPTEYRLASVTVLEAAIKISRARFDKEKVA